jgi:hypothetical protein
MAHGAAFHSTKAKGFCRAAMQDENLPEHQHSAHKQATPQDFISTFTSFLFSFLPSMPSI